MSYMPKVILNFLRNVKKKLLVEDIVVVFS